MRRRASSGRSFNTAFAMKENPNYSVFGGGEQEVVSFLRQHCEEAGL